MGKREKAGKKPNRREEGDNTMKLDKIFDLYSDYVISEFGLITATGLSDYLEGVSYPLLLMKQVFANELWLYQTRTP